jgi:hypothetical protein
MPKSAQTIEQGMLAVYDSGCGRVIDFGSCLAASPACPPPQTGARIVLDFDPNHPHAVMTVWRFSGVPD